MDRDEMLLMYVSGELPAAEHSEVERRAAQDPEWAQALHRVRELNSGVADLLSHLDGHSSSAASIEDGRRSAAVRRVSRAIVQKRVSAPLPVAAQNDEPRNRSLLPRWSYPFVAAAVIVVAMVALVEWGGNEWSEQSVTSAQTSLEERAARREKFIQSFADETFAVDAMDRGALVLSTGPDEYSAAAQPDLK